MTKKARIAQVRLLRLRLLKDIQQCTKALAALETTESKVKSREKQPREKQTLKS